MSEWKNAEHFFSPSHCVSLCGFLLLKQLCNFSLNTFPKNCVDSLFCSEYCIREKKTSEFFEFSNFCNLCVGVNTHRQNVSDNIRQYSPICHCDMCVKGAFSCLFFDQGTFWFNSTTWAMGNCYFWLSSWFQLNHISFWCIQRHGWNQRLFAAILIKLKPCCNVFRCKSAHLDPN